MALNDERGAEGVAKGGSRSSPRVTRAPGGGRARLGVVVALALMLATAAPASAAEEMTVGEWRAFVTLVERTYGVQVAHVAAHQFAAGATAHGHVWLGCLRPGRTVRQLAAWLRETAPAVLTIRQALALDAEQHGCAPRAQEEIDAELKSGVGPPATGDAADLLIRDPRSAGSPAMSCGACQPAR